MISHPDLAARARAAGMKTLGELEIFPDTQKGFRLPLCAGRTMLLDRPLELVFDNRLKREIHDVIGYVTWLSLDRQALHARRGGLPVHQDEAAASSAKAGNGQGEDQGCQAEGQNYRKRDCPGFSSAR